METVKTKRPTLSDRVGELEKHIIGIRDWCNKLENKIDDLDEDSWDEDDDDEDTYADQLYEAKTKLTTKSDELTELKEVTRKLVEACELIKENRLPTSIVNLMLSDAIIKARELTRIPVKKF